MEAAARLSGSRFAYLKGDLVLLELALVRYALELVRGEGHEPVVPPVLVREEALYGTGFLPGDRDQIYEIPKDDLFLVGTSEVPLAGLHADQILDADQLPLRYAASRPASAARPAPPAATRAASSASTSSTRSRCSRSSSRRSRPPSTSGCWRSRSASSPSWRSPTGSSTSPPATSARPAAKKYDCEAWIPSQGRYRELTSCSNTTDYQARRLGCRYRPADGETPQAVHTLNGTAVAVGRTMIALIENRQERDGGFTLPNIFASVRLRLKGSAAR